MDRRRFLGRTTQLIIAALGGTLAAIASVPVGANEASGENSKPLEEVRIVDITIQEQ